MEISEPPQQPKTHHKVHNEEGETCKVANVVLEHHSTNKSRNIADTLLSGSRRRISPFLGAHQVQFRKRNICFCWSLPSVIQCRTRVVVSVVPPLQTESCVYKIERTGDSKHLYVETLHT